MGAADFVVPRGGKCGAGTMLGLLHKPQNDDRALIDLREATWVEPIGLVAIAAFAESQQILGRQVQLLGPTNWSVANYLSRMRVGNVIESMEGEHDLNAVREHEASELLELQRFEGEEDATELAALAYDRTANLPEVASALHQSICEIGANVPQHSGRSSGYVAAVSTHDKEVFQFAVGDAGIGLSSTLAAVGSTGDADAIEKALEHGVTRSGVAGEGRGPGGIQETRNLVTQLRGAVHLVSGTAARTSMRSTSRSFTGRLPYPGTLFQGKLLCP